MQRPESFHFHCRHHSLILPTHHTPKNHHPDFFGKEIFSRKHPRYSGIPNDPFETRPNRRGRKLGEKPRMWDSWTASPPVRVSVGAVTLASALVCPFHGQLQHPC